MGYVGSGVGHAMETSKIASNVAVQHRKMGVSWPYLQAGGLDRL